MAIAAIGSAYLAALFCAAGFLSLDDTDFDVRDTERGRQYAARDLSEARGCWVAAAALLLFTVLQSAPALARTGF